MNTPAGEGEHKPYYLPGPKTEPLISQRDYLGVDAVNWFVNKQSGWWNKYSASGTLEITLASGQEKYEVPLGVYELAGGARLAPVFDRAVLPDRVYRGGPVSFRVMISGLNKDTRLTKLIKSATSAAFGVVGGMVATATATGPYVPLAAAGSALIGGVQEVLNVTDEELRLFDPSGFEVNLQQKMITGRESFLFLHRGAPLERKKLNVEQDDDNYVVRYDGDLLEDGVWLLLRLRTTTEYPLERPWLGSVRRWTAGLVGLVDDVKSGRMANDEGLGRLRPGSETQATDDDVYRVIRSEILSDGVLTVEEATAYALALAAYRELAVAAVADAKYDKFFNGIRSLKSGTVVVSDVDKLTDTERRAAASTRSEVVTVTGGVSLARQSVSVAQQPLLLKDYGRLLNRISIERSIHSE